MRNALIVLLLLLATPAMALKWSLKIPGVPAEVTVLMDLTELESLRYGARATPGRKSAISDYTLSKPFGATSLTLLSAMATKRRFETVTLEARTASGVVVESIVLSGVQVTAYSSAAGRAGGLIDTISLSVERVVLDAFQARVDWDQVTGRIQ